MKAFTTIIKILAVIAAVAGIIFILATYGDQIVAWCKRLVEKVRSYRSDFDHEGEFGDSYEEFSIPDDEDSVAADVDFE